VNFITYFDSNYAHKGWACHKTLYKYLGSNLKFYLLCLDDNIYAQAMNKKDQGVVPILLSDIESYRPRLTTVKHTRERKEYYATLTPLFPQFVFDTYGEDLVFYTDADIAFWSDPTEMKEVLGDKSLMVVDHGIEPPRSKVRFNVGILAYRNDECCREFLDWWFDRTMEWCEWKTMPDGRCADQGYLNILHDEPNRFKNHLSCPHPGINMGPWNIGLHKTTLKDGKPIVDGKYNLICYHYHEFRMIGDNSYHPTGWKHTDSDREIIYEPYFNMIREVRSGK
jgi:hypothetical protein